MKKKKIKTKKAGKIHGSLFDLAAKNFSSSLNFETKVIWGGVDSNKRFTLDYFKEEEGL